MKQIKNGRLEWFVKFANVYVPVAQQNTENSPSRVLIWTCRRSHLRTVVTVSRDSSFRFASPYSPRKLLFDGTFFVFAFVFLTLMGAAGDGDAYSAQVSDPGSGMTCSSSTAEFVLQPMSDVAWKAVEKIWIPNLVLKQNSLRYFTSFCNYRKLLTR